MLGKKERRRLRHERNVEKDKTHKKEAWEAGKLIEENHNQGPYSVEYTMNLTSRLVQYILDEKKKSEGDGSKFVEGFRKYRKKVIDCILHYNPSVPKGPDYHYLKNLLEVYWDEVLVNGNNNALLGV